MEVYKVARPMLGFLRWHEQSKPTSPLADELVDEFLANANWWEYSHPADHINIE